MLTPTSKMNMIILIFKTLMSWTTLQSQAGTAESIILKPDVQDTNIATYDKTITTMFRNLTYKTVMGHMWVSTFCSQADIVVKAN